MVCGNCESVLYAQGTRSTSPTTQPYPVAVFAATVQEMEKRQLLVPECQPPRLKDRLARCGEDDLAVGGLGMHEATADVREYRCGTLQLFAWPKASSSMYFGGTLAGRFNASSSSAGFFQALRPS